LSIVDRRSSIADFNCRLPIAESWKPEAGSWQLIVDR
jgi:hypothetical protein